MRRMGSKDPAVLAAMEAAKAAYTGPIRRISPGVARGHEFRVSYAYEPPRPEKPVPSRTASASSRE
jgi:hypothetical protein